MSCCLFRCKCANLKCAAKFFLGCFSHLQSLVSLNQSQVWFPLCEHSNYTWVWTKTITQRLCRGGGSGPVPSSRAVCLWCEFDLSQLPGIRWKFKLNAYRTQVCFTFWDAPDYYRCAEYTNHQYGLATNHKINVNFLCIYSVTDKQKKLNQSYNLTNASTSWVRPT